MNRLSNLLGRVLGRRGLLTFYQCYMVAMLPKSMFKFLFEHYRPALVISTAVHHSETWPLTYYAQRYGVKTLGNVLSWDNTTTKPALDPACDVCAVWSNEMAGEIDRHFPISTLRPVSSVVHCSICTITGVSRAIARLPGQPRPQARPSLICFIRLIRRSRQRMSTSSSGIIGRRFVARR